jgi:hypothetical protein
MLFYLRRRRSLTPTVVFEGDVARHMDQVQYPMSDQGVRTETLPETIPPLKPYVNVFVSLDCDYVCSHVFSLFLTLRTRMTQRRTPGTKEFNHFSHHRPTFPVKYLLYPPPEVNTRLPPRRALKHRDIVAYPSSDLIIALLFLFFPLVVHLVSR